MLDGSPDTGPVLHPPPLTHDAPQLVLELGGRLGVHVLPGRQPHECAFLLDPDHCTVPRQAVPELHVDLGGVRSFDLLLAVSALLARSPVLPIRHRTTSPGTAAHSL